MLELTRGYAAGILDQAEEAGYLAAAVDGLAALRRALIASEPLRTALTDSSVATEYRGAVVSDLLEPKVHAGVVSLATFVVVYERAAEFPKTTELLLELAEVRAEAATAHDPVVGEPPIGRAGALERIRGFAEQMFERIGDQSAVDAVEDELFRFARIAEQSRELRSTLSAPNVPVVGRLALLNDLLGNKVRPETLALVGYAIRAGRARDLVGAVDYLVELAAAERGRRVADVRSAVELSADEQDRLASALSRRTRRTVELRIALDPSVIGGIGVSVGDTVIDGTVRHRLEQLRDTILQAS